MISQKIILNTIVNNDDFSLIPYNQNPDIELKKLFYIFKSFDKNSLYKCVLEYHEEYEKDNFEKICNTIKHYKGVFEYFDTSLSFEVYKKIKPWLDINSQNKFKFFFFREYGLEFLENKITTIDEELVNFILKEDIKLYIQLAKKLNIPDACKKIFNNNPNKIYMWLNNSENIYTELHKLNQPAFILQTMNNNLNATDGALKYIIEHTEQNIEIFLSIKKRIGIKKLWNLSKNIIDISFFTNLIENLNDLIFMINIDDLSLSSLELILNKLKDKFPLIYSNLNSLMFVKNEFNNK